VRDTVGGKLGDEPGQVGDTVKEKWVTKRRQGGGHGAKHSDRQAGKQVRDKVEGGRQSARQGSKVPGGRNSATHSGRQAGKQVGDIRRQRGKKSSKR